ncbi:carbohydrate ABC transporter permease [Microbacterium sp. QXD-8]|uniref:Carbohydrate ABC transporter permease n=1 Tax=Microbacterium psychrotolerans TaxID=3068321 RepID=A0ABU0YYB4_9MICO|nr:carbohydrate ABC transporter permease [Microbacterium sp. QXD-8]MDQ7876536.1 carbohydrate ABC transporter permease [Microbacterium sp. QXD-8]
MTSATLPRRARMPITLVMLLVSATIVYPLLYLGISAFRTKSDYLADPFGIPQEWTLQNFVTLWNNYNVGQALTNSFVVVIVGLFIQVVVGVLAGFALAKYPVPGGRLISATFVSIMLVPSTVLIIPIYLLLAQLGLVSNLAGLIIVYVGTGLPFTTFFLTVSFRSIDESVLEAARIDGAGFVRTLAGVAAPMGISAIATIAVLQFLAMWNELLYAYILLPDDQLRLITPTLASIGSRFVSDQPLVSAGLLITAIPPLILLGLASRYVMSGVGASFGR